MLDNDGIQSINQSTNQSIKFIILIAHCRLDFTINSSIQILKNSVYNVYSIQRIYKYTTVYNEYTTFVRQKSFMQNYCGILHAAIDNNGNGLIKCCTFAAAADVEDDDSLMTNR